jgi:hypothetical protein
MAPHTGCSFRVGRQAPTSIATIHHYGIALQYNMPLAPMILAFSHLVGPRISQHQFVCEKGNARLGNNASQGNRQARTQSHHVFLRIDQSTGLHETNGASTGSHNSTPNDLMGITNRGRCHFCSKLAPATSLWRILVPCRLKSFFELFVDGKLNGRVRQSVGLAVMPLQNTVGPTSAYKDLTVGIISIAGPTLASAFVRS